MSACGDCRGLNCSNGAVDIVSDGEEEEIWKCIKLMCMILVKINLFRHQENKYEIKYQGTSTKHILEGRLQQKGNTHYISLYICFQYYWIK